MKQTGIRESASGTISVRIDPESPVGSFVEYTADDDQAAVNGELPPNWQADYSNQITTDSGRFRAPLTPIIDIAELAGTIDEAALAWTGISWDTAPSTLARRLTKAADLSRPESERSQETLAAQRVASTPADFGGVFFGADRADPEVDALHVRWAALATLVSQARDHDIGLLAEESIDIAIAESAIVEVDAKEAAKHGWRALTFIRNEEWGQALAEIHIAAGIERRYGNAPTWGPILEMIGRAMWKAMGVG